MEQHEEERKRRRRQALEEYERIVSYEISPSANTSAVPQKRKHRFRFRNILFTLLIIITAACYFFIGKQLSDSNTVNKSLQKELSDSNERLNRLETEWNVWKEKESETFHETASADSVEAEEPFTAKYPLTGSCVLLHTFGDNMDAGGSTDICLGMVLETEPDTYVISAAAGTVIFAGEDPETGITIRIDHGNGYISHYCHVSDSRVSMGDTVAAGQVIALPGMPDGQNICRMEFRISYHDNFVNPEELLDING